MSHAEDPCVGLDVTQAVKRRGRGIARYIREVVDALPEDALATALYVRGHRWFRRGLVDDLAPERPRRWLVNPRRLRARNLSLFHSFGNHLPASAPCPTSFTVHDVRALDEPAGYEGKERLERNLRRAAGVICLTRHGRERLTHHHPELVERPLAVIPHGVDHERFHPRPAPETGSVAAGFGLDAPYLLQLGSWFPHKNLELSLAGWVRSRTFREGVDLVFAGGGAPSTYARQLERLAASTGAAGRVHWIEHVPGAQLPALLAGASGLLQPSRYEGFALPVLEAMASGVPGVVSSASCLPEVSAGLWPLAETDDARAFADGIDRIVLDGAFRERAIAAGIEHAAAFTWARSARAHDDFFRILSAGDGA